MGYEKLTKNNAIRLGGVNKQTGKINPTEFEGYFVRTREIGPNKFNSSKTDYIHDFVDATGNEASVWGATDLNSLLRSARTGRMTKISLGGKQDVGKGNPMQLYNVFQDADNTIAVEEEGDSGYVAAGGTDTDEVEEETHPADDTTFIDETRPERAAAPKQAAALPNAARAAKVKALLNGNGGARKTA